MDLSRPLDLEDSASGAFLASVQSNILKGHGREFGRYLMARFSSSSSSPYELRGWLAALAAEVVHSAADQSEQTDRFKALRRTVPRPKGDLLGSIGVSREGYAALGLSSAAPGDNEFSRSLFASPRAEDRLTYAHLASPWDPCQRHWEPGYRGLKDGDTSELSGSIHLFIHLAADDEQELRERALLVKRRVAEVGEIVADELGKRRIHRFVDRKVPLEHFGFADGVSSPRFIRQEAPDHRRWPRRREAAALSLLFAEEPALPGVSGHSPTHGSYGVFLKLEQNVLKFQESSAAASFSLSS